MSRLEELLKTRLEELQERVALWDKQYYENDSPTVPDSVYDAARSELNSLLVDEEHIPKVSHKHGLGKTVHETPMMSIRTEINSSYKGALDFVSRVQTALSSEMIGFVAEPKYDGLAISLTYGLGKLVMAATRGDGLIGEIVTDAVRRIPTVPHTLTDAHAKTIGLLCVRGEVVFTLDNFEKVKALPGCEYFKDPRNAAAGIIRGSKPHLCEYLTFIPYSVSEINDMGSQSKALKWLHGVGFTGGDVSTHSEVVYAAKDLYDTYTDIEATRSSRGMPYLDGVVYKVNKFEDQEALGWNSLSPKWALAHKFEPVTSITQIIDIATQVSGNGVLTPVAILMPIRVGRVDVSRATLNNQFEIRKKKVRVGDFVEIRRAGDVIPEIVGRADIPQSLKAYRPNYRAPKTCPICDGPTKRLKGSRVTKCINMSACPGQIKGTIAHFVSRLGMNVRGMGDTLVDTLVSAGVLTRPEDVYTLTDSTLMTKADMSRLEAEKLMKAIEVSKHVELPNYLYALGIPEIGKGTCALLSEKYLSMDRLLNEMWVGTVTNRGPLGPDPMLMKAKPYLDSPKVVETMARLKELGVVIKSVKSTQGRSGPLADTTVCISGSPKNSIRETLESLGATVVDSMSKRVSILVLGDNPGETKIEAAKRLKIKTLYLGELMEELSE